MLAAAALVATACHATIYSRSELVWSSSESADKKKLIVPQMNHEHWHHFDDFQTIRGQIMSELDRHVPPHVLDEIVADCTNPAYPALLNPVRVARQMAGTCACARASVD